MQTILITGGAGFIGSCLVRQLLNETSLGVVNLDLLTYAGSLDSLLDTADNPRYTFVHGDIGDRDLVHRILNEHRPDALVNLAAESHVDRSIAGPLPFVQTNVVGTVHLLTETLSYWESLPAAKANAFRFLQVSTDEVYGSVSDESYFTEETAYAPNSPYSASKASADHFARAFHRTYGLPLITTHCGNNYGPYQFPEKLIPRMTLNAIGGKSLPVYGDGRHVRDWLHVEDHCRALRCVLENGIVGSVYNIGGNSQQTNLDVVLAICDQVDRLLPDLPHAPCKSLVRHVADRPGHDRRYAIDITKIETELGWQPTISWAEGLQRTVQWYVDHLDWAQSRDT